jgi:putative ABC transport system permease protein
MSFGNDTVSSGDRSRQILVLGTSLEMLELRDLDLRSGSFLPEGPWDRGSSVIVLGLGASRELFGSENPVGQVVRLGGWRMRVVGVMGSQGVHFGIDMDETAFVPVATALAMFDESSLARIGVEVRGGIDMERTVERVRSILIERHGEEDFTIVTPDAMLDALGSILAALTLAVAGIGAISLAVAGIGIMNVMLVSVSERTAEVGLMKAIGATRGQIVAVFLAEAVLLSALGGALGIAVGLGAVHLLAVPYPALGGRAPLWAVAAALGLALAFGALFGVLPARKAAGLDPVVALSGRRG